MGLGFGQILILLIIILILFGAGKLPKVMKDLSKGMKAFKEGLHEEEELEKTPPTALEEHKPSLKNSTSQKRKTHKKAS